jgi:hypothetical protein
MIPAKMAWGVWVDFHEPRTQMTLRVIAVGVVFLVLAWWIDQPRFTAIVLIAFALILLFLVRSTSVIRHPANPVGESPDRILPLIYAGITLSAVLAALFLTATLVGRSAQKRQQNW